MTKPKTYMDIGHGGADSFLWIVIRGKLDIRRTGSRTHEKIWGKKAMDYWRGRYDIKKNQISIMPPVTKMFRQVPQSLVDMLKEAFGEDAEPWDFNPPRSRK